MTRYQYILLDWDGNLAKTLDIWLDAYRVVLEKRGMHFTDEEIATGFGIPRKRFQEWGITDVQVALDEMDAYARAHLPNVDLYPDALPVLEALREAGKKTALITTSLHANVKLLLEKYDIEHLFDVVIAYDDTEQHKPHPEPLQKALSILGGNASDAVMIGDSDKDLGAAQNAGVDSVLFYPPEHSKYYQLDELKTHNPTYIVTDFREILDIV
jgi:pyrophosphatase PpaX